MKTFKKIVRPENFWHYIILMLALALPSLAMNEVIQAYVNAHAMDAALVVFTIQVVYAIVTYYPVLWYIRSLLRRGYTAGGYLLSIATFIGAFSVVNAVLGVIKALLA